MGELFTASTKGVPSHWPSPAPVEYYLKLANVIKVGAPADLLAQDSPAVTEAVDLSFQIRLP